MNDGDRLTPVTLTGEYPVTKLVVDSLTANAHFLNDHGSFLFQFCGLSAIPLTGIDHDTGSLCISLCHVLDLFSVFCDDLNDRNIEFGCESEITVVMSRYTHDGAGTIVSQYIVRQPDGGLFAVQRVDGIGTGKYAGFLLILHTVYI